ncbi:MAG: hypothetical protein LBT70_00630, partial [Holosporaceae bacterium]|nr:hypothetical protein [Holosporaceae bacterium]
MKKYIWFASIIAIGMFGSDVWAISGTAMENSAGHATLGESITAADEAPPLQLEDWKQTFSQFCILEEQKKIVQEQMKDQKSGMLRLPVRNLEQITQLGICVTEDTLDDF